MIDGGETTELIPPFYFQIISQWDYRNENQNEQSSVVPRKLNSHLKSSIRKAVSDERYQMGKGDLDTCNTNFCSRRNLQQHKKFIAVHNRLCFYRKY